MNKSKKNISIVGQGYVGLEVAIALAKAGSRVFGIDSNSYRVEAISKGHSPVENVSDEDLNSVLNRNYQITSDYSPISDSEIVIICVPTPLDEQGLPDLSLLRNAVNSISQHVTPGTLVINESTSFPGTLREHIEKPIREKSGIYSNLLEFAVAPERVSPGSSIPIKEVSRVVSGTTNSATNRALQMYGLICDYVFEVETPEVAEMSKLLENSFRQINIAFINELNQLCMKTGIPINQVIEAAATKPYGFMAFYPGPGIGGHCIPVDPLYLSHYAKSFNIEMSMIKAARDSDLRHQKHLCQTVIDSFSDKTKLKIIVMGIAYKSGVSDVRESPAINIINFLRTKGHQVGWFDDLITEWNNEHRSSLEEDWDAAIFTYSNQESTASLFQEKPTKVFTFGYEMPKLRSQNRLK